MADPDGHAALRQLPAVSALLAAPDVAPLIERHGRSVVADAARCAIATTRSRVLSGAGPATVSAGPVLTATYCTPSTAKLTG